MREPIYIRFITRWEKESPCKLTQEELIQFLNDIQEGVYSEPKTQ